MAKKTFKFFPDALDYDIIDYSKSKFNYLSFYFDYKQSSVLSGSMASQPLTINENNESEQVENNEWVDFCKKKVDEFSSDFAKAWHSYILLNNNFGTSGISTKNIVQKLSDLIPQALENALSQDNEIEHNNSTSSMPMTTTSSVPTVQATSEDNLEGVSDESPESPSLKTTHKPFFRRLSFKGLRKGKGLFLKQHSDEVELSPHHERQPGRGEKSRLKTVKLSVECLKESVVHLLNGDTNEGQLNCIKSRKSLIKLGAGHLIEFYSPPKSIKPKTGIFCISINEIRETTEIEMPDLRNTFVIKVSCYGKIILLDLTISISV